MRCCYSRKIDYIKPAADTGKGTSLLSTCAGLLKVDNMWRSNYFCTFVASCWTKRQYKQTYQPLHYSKKGQVNPLAATSIHPNQVSGFESVYDPLSDNIESVQQHNDSPLPGLLPNPVEGKVVPAKNLEVLPGDILTSRTGGPNGNDQYKLVHSEIELDHACPRSEQPNPVANCDEGNNIATVEESHKTHENKPMEKMNEDGRAEEGKKKNDGKAI